MNYIRRARAILEREGDDESALEAFEAAVKLDPSHFPEIEAEYGALRERLSDRSCFMTSRVPGGAAVYDAVVCRGGALVICATADASIYVFSTAAASSGAPRAVLEGHGDMVTTLALSPDGRMLLSGSLDKTVRVWDVTTLVDDDDDHEEPIRLEPVATLEGHANRINWLRWTPCGTRAISSSTDCSLRLWDVAGATCIGEMTGHGSLVSSIDLSKDGTVCASASGDAVCKLWAIPSRRDDKEDAKEDDKEDAPVRLLEDIAWESGPVVLCEFVDYALHGEYLLTAHAQLVQQQARILLWDVFDKETGWVDGRLRAPCYAIDDLRGCPTGMDTIRVEGGEFAGTELLTCSCSDGKVHVWDIDECPVKLATFSLEEPGRSLPDDLPAWSIAHLRHASNKLNLVAFSPSGTYLAATRSETNSVVVWDVDEGECVCQLYGHRAPIRKVVWISDYKLISVSEDGTGRGWTIPAMTADPPPPSSLIC